MNKILLKFNLYVVLFKNYSCRSFVQKYFNTSTKSGSVAKYDNIFNNTHGILTRRTCERKFGARHANLILPAK